jgi:hypothetical protein
VLLVAALLWTFVIEPRRMRVTSVMVPETGGAGVPAPERASPAAALGAETSRELLRSLERMEADLAELRAEVERMRSRLAGARQDMSRRS